MADQENAASESAPADGAAAMTDQIEAAHNEAQAAFDEVTSGSQADSNKKVESDDAGSDSKNEAEAGAKQETEQPKETEQEKAATSERVMDIFPVVEKYHPGARAKAATPEFQGWLNTLPKHYQDMIDRGDPVEAAMLLDMYDKEGKGLPVSDAKKLEQAPITAPAYAPLTFDTIKDLKIKDDDGEDMTLAEFAKEYEEISNAALAIANQVVQAALKSLPTQEQKQPADYLKKAELETFKSQMDAELFEGRVERMHPGAVKKATSDEFRAYLKQASPMQVKLFAYGSPDDVVSVLNEYDRVQAIDKAKAAQNKQTDRKKALDGLHGNSLKAVSALDRAKKPSQDGQSPEQATVEAREGFEEALQEIENERQRRK
mgnify:CR=1 FL=1